MNKRVIIAAVLLGALPTIKIVASDLNASAEVFSLESEVDVYTGTEDLNKTTVVKEVVVEKPKAEHSSNDNKGTAVNMQMVEQKPSFPGGDKAMSEWLAANIKYPEAAVEDGASGKVVVQFVVEKDGSISNVKIVRGRHPALDEEAIRVVKKMPKWVPGRNYGEIVRVVQLLPITFK